MDYLLSVDIGTTALKSSIVARDGTIIAAESRSYPVIAEGNAMEQDPRLWWGAFCETARVLVQSNPSLVFACVVLSGQMQDLIQITSDGIVAGNAILYSDTRYQEEFNRYGSEFGSERAMGITRNGMDASALPPKLLHAVAVNSDPSIRYLLGAHDYVCWKLTGCMVTDLTNAATTGLLDYAHNCWSSEILEYIGIGVQQLPQLENGPVITGTVTEAASCECGLRVGLPVIHGSGDAGASTVGVGAADASIYSCYLGTSGWLAATLPSPIDPHLGVFNLRHPDGQQTITIGAMRTTGGNISWLLDLFDVLQDPYGYLQEEASKAPVGSHGVFYLPYPQGERMPFNDPHARGAFIGMTRQTGQPEMFRAVIEGIAYGIASIHEVLHTNSQEFDVAIVASGGGAENVLLNQTIADVLGVPVRRIANAANSGVLGNLVIAGNALGWFSDFSLPESCLRIDGEFMPDPANHTYHEKALPIFKRLHHALSEEFCAIANLYTDHPHKEKGEVGT